MPEQSKKGIFVIHCWKTFLTMTGRINKHLNHFKQLLKILKSAPVLLELEVSHEKDSRLTVHLV